MYEMVEMYVNYCKMAWAAFRRAHPYGRQRPCYQRAEGSPNPLATRVRLYELMWVDIDGVIRHIAVDSECGRASIVQRAIAPCHGERIGPHRKIGERVVPHRI